MPQIRGLSAASGIVHLFPLILFGVVALFTVGLLLIYNGTIKNPAPGLIRVPGQEAQVELKADYKNPLDKTSQYMNPFASYKNPFDTLAK